MSQTPNTSSLIAARSLRRAPSSAREYQELWMSLEGREWSSVVLVPAGRDGSAASVASALAGVGNELGGVPVSAVTLGAIEQGATRDLDVVKRHVQDVPAREEPERRAPLVDVTTADPPWCDEDRRNRAVSAHEALAPARDGRLVIAIPPVVDDPLGIGVARRADVVIVVVEMGRTSAGDVRRTLELIGRDRIAGCVVVR